MDNHTAKFKDVEAVEDIHPGDFVFFTGMAEIDVSYGRPCVNDEIVCGLGETFIGKGQRGRVIVYGRSMTVQFELPSDIYKQPPLTT